MYLYILYFRKTKVQHQLRLPTAIHSSPPQLSTLLPHPAAFLPVCALHTEQAIPPLPSASFTSTRDRTCLGVAAERKHLARLHTLPVDLFSPTRSTPTTGWRRCFRSTTLGSVSSLSWTARSESATRENARCANTVCEIWKCARNLKSRPCLQVRDVTYSL